MKASTSILIASAVVLASSIYAHPTLLKRVGNVADAIACVTPIILNPLQATSAAISACQSKLTQDVGLVTGATVTNLQFDLRGDVPTIAVPDITVAVVSFPLLSSIPVSRAKLNLAIMDGSANTGSFASVWVDTTPNGFSVDCALPVTSLTITAEQTSAFITLLSALATTESHAIVLSGSIDVDLSISVSNMVPDPLSVLPAVAPKVVSLTGVGISAPIVLKGFNNFGGVAYAQVDANATIQTSATGVRTIQGKVTVTSPSDVSVDLGDIDFQLWSTDAQPVYLGIATVANLSLVSGQNTFAATLTIDAAVQTGKYFPVKAGLKLSVNGFAGSSKNPIAAGVVASVKFDLVF